MSIILKKVIDNVNRKDVNTFSTTKMIFVTNFDNVYRDHTVDVLCFENDKIHDEIKYFYTDTIFIYKYRYSFSVK